MAAFILNACNSEKKESETIEPVEEAPKAKVDYAYKATISPDFSIGNADYAKIVLDYFKMWEDGKIEDMKSLLSDSVFIEGPDGFKCDITVDSCINLLKEARANYKSQKIEVDTWVPVHHKETSDDYLLVWFKDVWTTANEKADSSRYHAYFHIKDNKMRGWSEFEQKLKMVPPPAAK